MNDTQAARANAYLRDLDRRLEELDKEIAAARKAAAEALHPKGGLIEPMSIEEHSAGMLGG